MEINQAFGIQLREVRRQARLTQDELAHRAGLHRTYISLLERGMRSATLDTVFRICAALDLDPGAFVSSLLQLLHRDSSGRS
jgi:transcriptional regulator with XRE-family HTH domain